MNRNTSCILFIAIIVFILFVGWYYTHNQLQIAKSPLMSNGASVFVPGAQIKFSSCQTQDKYPDHACTPGNIIPTASKEQICIRGYSSSVRNVKESEKLAVYKEYGITHRVAGEYEIDHFISLELGGSNDLANLFPEAAEPKPGFHEKDKVENYLHEQVCAGSLSLNEAQREIATDWYAVFEKIK